MRPEAGRSEGICLLAYAFLFARKLNYRRAGTSGIVVRHLESVRAKLLSSVRAGIESLDSNLDQLDRQPDPQSPCVARAGEEQQLRATVLCSS